MKQEKVNISFEVIMKDKTSKREINKLIEEILKNKSVEYIKGTISVDLKIKNKSKKEVK